MPAPLGNPPWDLELGLKMVKNIDFHVQIDYKLFV